MITPVVDAFKYLTQVCLIALLTFCFAENPLTIYLRCAVDLSQTNEACSYLLHCYFLYEVDRQDY